MIDYTNRIREVLDEIDALSPTEDSGDLGRDFSALELPSIIQQVVDDLQPLLTPYEAAYYWYAFRHTIGRDGSRHVRLSTRGLQTGVVKSRTQVNADENRVSQQKVSEALRALGNIGALRKDGEHNREGTLYRVMIPEEIEDCRKYRAARVVVEPSVEIKMGDIDFYNVRENRIKVWERDDYTCYYCGKQLTRFTATLDHLTAVANGGDNSFDNLMTACHTCNSKKQHRPLGDFLAES